MKFAIDHKIDVRVVESTPAPLPFPGRIEALPLGPGVITLTDDIDIVVYVGWGESIRQVVEYASHNAVAGASSKLRWFRTSTAEDAKAMGKSLVRKYRPKGNDDDSQWGATSV